MVAINPETGERKHGTATSEARRIFENLKLLPPFTIASAMNPSAGIVNLADPGRLFAAPLG